MIAAPSSNAAGNILVIRFGALGDILHALPAVASLKRSFPQRKIIWLVARKWQPVLDGNPDIDKLIPFDRAGFGSFAHLNRLLRPLQPDLAVDFQGLLQSAIAGRFARPRDFFGFDRTVAREPLASRLYTHRIHVTGPHRIERNLQLIAAAGATEFTHESWIPAGVPEGSLPVAPFVLASPFAGWSSKQWPLESYSRLGRALSDRGLELVLNVPPERAAAVSAFAHVHVHSSSLLGLIDATRRATAVVGVDSGPLHLAAALNKSGVAIFGPTDPAQTGPFRSPMIVLRDESARTTYKRGNEVHQAMRTISPEQVADAVFESLRERSVTERGGQMAIGR